MLRRSNFDKLQMRDKPLKQKCIITDTYKINIEQYMTYVVLPSVFSMFRLLIGICFSQILK